MSLVAKLLPPANVLLDLQVSSKKRLFEQVGLVFENHNGIARSLVFDSLFARERLGSTGLGQGVAIPHGRIKGLKDALGAVVRLAQPLPFDAPGAKPVTLLFVLLVPEQATEKHLQILSELAQMFSDRALRDAMTGAADAAALHQLIAAWQPDAAGQRQAVAGGQPRRARPGVDRRARCGHGRAPRAGRVGRADRAPQPHPSQSHPGRSDEPR